MPGTVEALQTALDVTAPRFALPPDQVLSTFPPASAARRLHSRLPQVVSERRTLPWERSEFTAGGRAQRPDARAAADDDAAPVARTGADRRGRGEPAVRRPGGGVHTSGTTLADPSDVDVPKATCLEIPESVVTKVFPALEDLPSLVHVREVDLNDTELALGDDDGWMAVVLCNRLPQAARATRRA